MALVTGVDFPLIIRLVKSLMLDGTLAGTSVYTELFGVPAFALSKVTGSGSGSCAEMLYCISEVAWS